MIATRRPSISPIEPLADRVEVEQRLRRVLVAAVASFSTLPEIHRVSACGAPEDEWRITTASAPIACSVSAVSFRLSPFDTLESAGREVDDVGRESLRGELERDPRARGVLVEQVLRPYDRGAPALS